jgi:TrmH family RNA methyltransferase
MRQANQPITGRHNELLKHARAVRDGRNRRSIFIEGIRLCEECERSQLQIETVIAAESLSANPRGFAVFSRLAQKAIRSAFVSDAIFNTLSDAEVHQGLLVLAAKPQTGPDFFLPATCPAPLYLILDGLSNPSNAGALLRSAEAAGVNGVIATTGTTYLFAPKALRGSMGALFRIPVWPGAGFSEIVAWCRANHVRTVCADINATQTHLDFDWQQPAALILGSEAHGLSENERQMVDELIRIPMLEPVESLNVAIAGSILVYEAARQRNIFSLAINNIGLRQAFQRALAIDPNNKDAKEGLKELNKQ